MTPSSFIHFANHAMAAQQPPAEQQEPVAAAQEPHFLPLVSAGETDHDSSDPETMKTNTQSNVDSDERRRRVVLATWRPHQG